MIQIGKHQVGAGQPPFIIAEVGSNWSTLEDCLTSISLAARCGADAVKFQAYTFEALTGHAQHPISDTHSRMAAGELPTDWLPKLKEKADACGIELMCSAFSPELYEAVDPFVNVHKVASAELTHLRILQTLRRLGKPVILSTGASGEADIRGAIDVLTYRASGPSDKKAAGRMEGVPVILMYCVAAYPAQSIELDVIPLMRKTFGVPVGYSDHSTDVLNIPVQACHWGNAVVLEKHVNFVESTGPDAPHSLNTDQFKAMVKRIRNEHTVAIGPSAEERGMITRHNRRLIATRDIPTGTALIEGHNFGIYRSLKDDTKAAHPFMIDQMVGKSVKRDIPAGDGIAPGDV